MLSSRFLFAVRSVSCKRLICINVDVRLMSGKPSADPRLGLPTALPRKLKDTGLKVPKEENVKREGVKSYWNVMAYATAEEYDIVSLAKALKAQNIYVPCELTSNEPLKSPSSQALHAIAKYQTTKELRHLYYFEDGVVVMWNLPEIEQHAVIDFLKPFEEKRYDAKIVQSELDFMKYTYDNDTKKTRIADGVMHVGSLEKTPEMICGEMYTLSNAMAMSVKLGNLECILSKFVEDIEPMMDDLKLGRPVKISRSGVLQKSGELYALRHSINLSTDLLDIPDFYWDRENLEGLYQDAYNYFSISRRTRVLNEKLNHCSSLLELVSSHLSDRHHVRLELMIIALIMIEVGFETVHFLKP
ncbi:unnamed protein product [Nesidiocoris tenuis]|uniref:DUF155 domain-containing protein n=2 Tax=Nesidiocoris tenuis TaxID=355587 RepID=A0A6H5G1X9_9HEMI|nr:Uncharacterised ACR, YagE family COG1723 [Nesidiocoris tenuis]CAA9996160.1 unnamed protein product [Nesidiocoris tenuis]CAA9996194.1 unnamed protein product [Nesidiocoris tenuis]